MRQGTHTHTHARVRVRYKRNDDLEENATNCAGARSPRSIVNYGMLNDCANTRRCALKLLTLKYHILAGY